jgi:hypothetical protein
MVPLVTGSVWRTGMITVLRSSFGVWKAVCIASTSVLMKSNAVASTGLGGDTIAEVTAGLSARGRQLLSG